MGVLLRHSKGLPNLKHENPVGLHDFVVFVGGNYFCFCVDMILLLLLRLLLPGCIARLGVVVVASSFLSPPALFIGVCKHMLRNKYAESTYACDSAAVTVWIFRYLPFMDLFLVQNYSFVHNLLGN